METLRGVIRLNREKIIGVTTCAFTYQLSIFLVGQLLRGHSIYNTKRTLPLTTNATRSDGMMGESGNYELLVFDGVGLVQVISTLGHLFSRDVL